MESYIGAFFLFLAKTENVIFKKIAISEEKWILRIKNEEYYPG